MCELASIAPVRYRPFSSGRYEVAPGLSRFGKDFGNGPADACAFQIDREFPRYRAAKLAARREDYGRYVCTVDLGPEVRSAVAAFIAARLVQEHPQWFESSSGGQSGGLRCRLTGESWSLTADGRLSACLASVDPPYADSLDALACQVQEDLAILTADGSGRDRISYLHLCLPNHWAATDKVGRDFATIHAPVAGIGAILQRADAHVRAMVSAEQGLVRFAWGVATDDELNHHPARDAATSARTFDPRCPRALVRVERQTLWGFPSVGASLFTIRTYFVDCMELKRSKPEQCAALATAVESMSPESAAYKGLSAWRAALVAWLRAR